MTSKKWAKSKTQISPDWHATHWHSAGMVTGARGTRSALAAGTTTSEKTASGATPRMRSATDPNEHCRVWRPQRTQGQEEGEGAHLVVAALIDGHGAAHADGAAAVGYAP